MKNIFKTISEYFSDRRECVRLGQQLVDLKATLLEERDKHEKETQEKEQWIHTLSRSIEEMKSQNNRLYEDLNKVKLLNKYEE